MEQPTQAEALRLADVLESNFFERRQNRLVWDAAAAELRRLHAELESMRGSRQAERAVPAEPTQAMISAMLASKARDDEGEFPALMDLIDYRGENKNHAVIRAAYAAMLAAAPVQQAAPAGDAKDAARYRYLRDGDWREREELEPVIRLQLNTLWDAKIDAAIASQQP